MLGASPASGPMGCCCLAILWFPTGRGVQAEPLSDSVGESTDDGVVDSIRECRSAGIIPIMITGDSLNTALAISKNIGLCSDDSEGIEGKELAKYSDSEMVNLVKKYRVYARVSPDDKVRIVKAWQKNGKVVAMTGDGVNDAPSIKLAHIGIGMGQTGTEVTKSVADVLLLDDCFNTIVGAIKEGRRIYNNIKSVILYSLSSNFAELFIVIIGMFMGINILLPIQILFIDLFTDAILSICMAFEHAGKNIMNVPPHKSRKFFTPFMTTFLGASAILECALIFIVYMIGYKNFGFEVYFCDSDEDAINKSEDLKHGSKLYPVHFSKSDTSGEKSFEEFVANSEQTDLTRFSSLGVITNKSLPDKHSLDNLLSKLNYAFSKNDTTIEEIVLILKEYLPNFNHLETGRSLDSKM